MSREEERGWEVFGRWKGYYERFLGDLVLEVRGREELELNFDAVDNGEEGESDQQPVQSRNASIIPPLNRRLSTFDSSRRASIALLESRRQSVLPLDSNRRMSVLPGRRGSEMVKSGRRKMVVEKSRMEEALERVRERICVGFVVGVLDVVEGFKSGAG